MHISQLSSASRSVKTVCICAKTTETTQSCYHLRKTRPGGELTPRSI